MKIKHLEKVYTGADNRSSLLDVSYPISDAKLPLIIFLHGFKGYKDWGAFPLLAQYFAENNFVFLKFNFSHNGGTVNEPIDFPDLVAFSKNTYSKELEDMNCIIDFLKNDSELKQIVDFNRIFLLGHSRGGAIAILSADQFSEIKKIATLAAVDNLVKRLSNTMSLEEWKLNGLRYIENSRTKQQMPMKYNFVEDLMENREKLDVEKACARLEIPQLIIHGEEDETINKEAAFNLKDRNPKAQLEIIKDANHTFGSKHPFKEEELPKDMKTASDILLKFFKSSF